VAAENAYVLDIIEKAKSGNQMAFSQLLDRYWPEVYHFQLKRTQNENDAEDITIQTFSRAFEKIDSYDPAYNFSTWLITISKNLHVDLLRQRKRNLLEGSDQQGSDAMKLILDESPSAEDQLIIEQNLKTLLRFLKRLKPAYREIIDLRYFQEMSYADIATKLGEPINTIKVKLLRAKKLLAALIADPSVEN
jgi:RNA polymerase sigma-70 factor (ECF subfamily)